MTDFEVTLNLILQNRFGFAATVCSPVMGPSRCSPAFCHCSVLQNLQNHLRTLPGYHRLGPFAGGHWNLAADSGSSSQSCHWMISSAPTSLSSWICRQAASTESFSSRFLDSTASAFAGPGTHSAASGPALRISPFQTPCRSRYPPLAQNPDRNHPTLLIICPSLQPTPASG